jgi:ABC-2 type transport system ATP-binding protein
MTLVALQKLTASDRLGRRGAARGRIVSAELFLVAGIHVVLGQPEDGTLALVEALSGALAPEHGDVLVAGLAPSRDAAGRRRIGALGPVPRLPEAPRVSSAVGLALAARGEARDGALAMLEAFGLGPLAARAPASLSYAEARAVELALCLSTPNPALLVLFEPLSDITLHDVGAVSARLRAAAAAGACVVIATSSPADARTLGDSIYLLVRGRFVRALPGDGVALAAPHTLPLVAWIEASEDAAALRVFAAALTARPEIQHVRCDIAAEGGGVVEVSGPDVDAVALALAEEATKHNVPVAAIGSAAPSLVEVHATLLAPVGARR